MIDNREVRVEARTQHRGKTTWRELRDLREDVQVAGADSLMFACMSVMNNATFHVTHDYNGEKVEALKVTAMYSINLPGGGVSEVSASVEVFHEFTEGEDGSISP